MEISVRSHLTAGVAAVVGAGAIAMTPVVMPTHTALSAAPVAVVADVQLAAFSFSDVLNILNTFGLGSALPNISSLLPSSVLTAAAGEFINEVTPVLTGAAGDVLGYLTATVTGLIAGPDSVLARVIGAAVNIPTVLGSAIQSLTGGNFAAAIQTVATGLIAPFTAIGQAVVDAVQSFKTLVTTKLSTVATALPNILLNSIQVALGGNMGSLLTTVQTAITNWISTLVPQASAVAPAAAVAASVTAAAAPVAAVAAAAPAVAAAAVAPRAARHAAPAAAAQAPAARSQAASAPAPRAAAARHARAAAAK